MFHCVREWSTAERKRYLTVFVSGLAEEDNPSRRIHGGEEKHTRSAEACDEIGCDRVLFVYYSRLTPSGEPFALKAI